MEVKINVAEILKDKPQGTKLYDLLRNIDVELDKVHTTVAGTYIECTSTNEVGSTLLFDYSKRGYSGYNGEIEVRINPTKKDGTRSNREFVLWSMEIDSIKKID